MTKDELITKQALKIEELEEEVRLRKEAELTIHRIIYCIGGPLNDNKLGYSRPQLKIFADIVNELNI